jgi:deoxyribonuclease V
MEESAEIKEGIIEKENNDNSKIDFLVKKYKIDLKKLEEEQTRLAKQLEIKDKIDFRLADRFGAFDNIFINNKLLTCIVVCNKDFEIIDRAYSFEKVNFPYIPGFRNYRELVPMINAFDKLSEKPDIVLIPGQGIIHPRLGLASHFSLSTGVATIGISNSIVGAMISGDDVIRNNKKLGKVLLSKPGSNPMFVSPGNFITIETCFEICKNMIKLPHKRPEVLHIASKYARDVRKELGN